MIISTLDLREQYLYKNPDNVAADFTKELGIKEVDVFLIKATSDLDKLKNFQGFSFLFWTQEVSSNRQILL